MNALLKNVKFVLNKMKMEEYLTTRIKELEDIEIEAQANNDWELATKVNFAKCELMDAKNEYRKIQLTM